MPQIVIIVGDVRAASDLARTALDWRYGHDFVIATSPESFVHHVRGRWDSCRFVMARGAERIIGAEQHTMDLVVAMIAAGADIEWADGE
jgi:hypothetical protein